MRREAVWFAGRGHDEITEVCRNVFEPGFAIWSEMRANQAEQMLGQLAAWRASQPENR